MQTARSSPCEVKWRHGAEQLQRAWNAHLPPCDLCSGSCGRRRRVSSALQRTVADLSVPGGSAAVIGERGRVPDRSPLTDRFAWYRAASRWTWLACRRRLTCLLGEHDFATFGQPTQGESTVRRVTRRRWQEDEGSVAELDSYPGRQLCLPSRPMDFLRQHGALDNGDVAGNRLGQAAMWTRWSGCWLRRTAACRLHLRRPVG